MALINCPSCDERIDLKHNSCPHCNESLDSFAVRTGPGGLSIRAKSFIAAFSIVVLTVLAAAFFNVTEYPQSLFFVVGCLVALLGVFMAFWVYSVIKS